VLPIAAAMLRHLRRPLRAFHRLSTTGHAACDPIPLHWWVCPAPYHYSVNPPFFPLPSNCHARLPANQYCYHLPSQSSSVQRPVHFAAPHFVYVYLFFQTTIRRYFIPFPRMLSSTEWSCQCDSTRDGSNFSFSSSLTHSCFEFEFCNSGPT